MPEVLADYSLTVHAVGALALVMLIQVLVIDVLGIRAGHAPGHPVPPDPSNAHFRAVRALANTNESVAVFLAAVLFSVWIGAMPGLVNGCAVAWVAARIAHMLCYYAAVPLLRSVSFGIGLVALVILVGGAWWSALA